MLATNDFHLSDLYRQILCHSRRSLSKIIIEKNEPKTGQVLTILMTHELNQETCALVL